MLISYQGQVPNYVGMLQYEWGTKVTINVVIIVKILQKNSQKMDINGHFYGQNVNGQSQMVSWMKALMPGMIYSKFAFIWT